LAVRTLATAPPRDGALRAFYEAHAESFARPGRVRVEGLFFSGDASVERGQAARERLLAGDAVAALAASADSPPVGVPGALATRTTIADTLGYAVAVAVDGQAEGGVTAPVPVPGGVWVVRVDEREPARLASFDEARDEVRVERARAQGEGP
jgi:hypothetical protein